MVSLRCKIRVGEELENLELAYEEINLGVIQLTQNITSIQHKNLSERLLKCGFELLEDKKSILVDSVKNVVIELVHYMDDLPKTNYSDYISEKVGYDYTYLANLFSAVKGTTIRHFIINHKIEKVKELLQYKELTLTQISYKMHYSSVAHLSKQFKKVTGISPSTYMRRSQKRCSCLDDI